MEKMPQAEALLKHLGFTEYESKAYLTLINHGALNADKVSSLSGIPLPRVYDTMNSLAERGLIFVSRTRPQIFKVIDPTQILNLLKEDEKRKIEKRVKKIETLIPQFLRLISTAPKKTEVETEEVIASIKRKLNMEKLWFDLHSGTKQEALIFAGDLSWVDKTFSLIKKMIRKGVKYKILWCKTGKEIIPRVKKLMKIGVELRYADTGDIRGVILDGKKISLVQTTGKTERDFTTIIISHKMITNIFRRYFLHLWSHGLTLDRLLKKSKK